MGHRRHHLQAAIDANPCAGGITLVADGTYESGCRAEDGAMRNRVVVDKPITCRPPPQAGRRRIRGLGPAGPSAVRCAYLANGGRLAGFTLTGGATEDGGSLPDWEQSAGGVLLAVGGTLSNCVVYNNTAYASGGGVLCLQGGTVVQCEVRGNTADYGAGFMAREGGELLNCQIEGNAALYGGGGYVDTEGLVRGCLVAANHAANRGGGLMCSSGGTVQNCTIVYNLADDRGSGVYCQQGGAVENSIVYFNGSDGGSDYYYTGAASLTIAVPPRHQAEPATWTAIPSSCFRRPATTGLAVGSPCLDAGLNQPWMNGAADLAGTPRIAAGTVDIGAYEVSPLGCGFRRRHGNRRGPLPRPISGRGDRDQYRVHFLSLGL